MDLDQISDKLHKHYAIRVSDISSVQGGWSALAFCITDIKEKYFLKLYDKKAASTEALTQQIDVYLPIMHWLERETPLNGSMPHLIPCQNGHLFYQDDSFIYVLFAFIDGYTIGDRPLESRQIKNLAKIVKTLHGFDANIPFKTDALKESFDITFFDKLSDLWSGYITLSGHTELGHITIEHKEKGKEKLFELKSIACSLQERPMRFVLCHTDIHGYNIMQCDRLVLLDWEGLKLAPREADLFMLLDKDDFLKHYDENYVPDTITLSFYRLHRVMQDIWELTERLLFDKTGAQEKDTLIFLLANEYNKLYKDII